MLRQTGWPGWGHGCRRLAAQWCSAEMDDAEMCAGYADGKLLVLLLPLRASRVFPLARSCISRAAPVSVKSTRGCRLEADKIREESRLSNPRWLSSPLRFVASPRGFSRREAEERCGARPAHWIGGQLYRFAFSIVACTRLTRIQRANPSNM